VNFPYLNLRSARRPLLTLLPLLTASAAEAQTVRKAEPVPDSVLFGEQTPAAAQRSRAALTAAEKQARKDPYNPAAVSARATALCSAGRAREAVDYLMDLKVQYQDFFPHQLALADSFAAARMFEDAAVAYQVVIGDNHYDREQQEAARTRMTSMTRDSRLIRGEHAVRTGDPAAARRVLEQLPAGDPDAIALQAAVLSKEGKFAEAREILNKVARTGHRSRTLAEARLALAESEARRGAWGPAAAGFRIAEKDPTLSARQQYRAAQMSRDLRERVAPTVSHSTWGSSGREGELWTSGIELSTGAFGDGLNILYLRGIWDELGLGHQQVITRADVDRWQAEIAWRRLTRRGFYGEVSGGTGDEGPVFGAAIGRYDNPAWQLTLRSGDRVADSLLLLALGGTQDSISFRYHRPLAEQWYLDASLTWRRIEIESAEIADGITLDFRLVRTLLEEGPGRPGLTIAYFAHIQDLNRRRLSNALNWQAENYGRRLEDPLDALIEDCVNRHGLVLTATKKFGARWSGFVYGGVAYEFEDERTAALAGAGLTAYLKENMTLTFSVDYASSGDGINEGDDSVTGFIKVRVSF
jgi:tetratricopeptide (TPR) repeat protein